LSSQTLEESCCGRADASRALDTSAAAPGRMPAAIHSAVMLTAATAAIAAPMRTGNFVRVLDMELDSLGQE
jgi:hypothetical protein